MGEQLDPVPFVAAAYATGSACIFGYALWLVLARRRLRSLLRAARANG